MKDGKIMNDIINYSTECLKLLTDKFKEKNIFHWIDFGTLLSAYRDGKMFDHDYDVDVCIFKDKKDDVVRILNELTNEKKLSILYGTEGNIIMIEFFGHDIKSRRFDIYICERNENFIGMLHYNGNFKFKSFYIDELETIKLGDYEFNCPRHLSSFLKLRYGKDYMKDIIFKTAYKRLDPSEPKFRTNSSSPVLAVNEKFIKK